MLCCSIGGILEEFEIKLTTSRPRDMEQGGPYWTVAKACLKEININVDDIRDYLIAGQNQLKSQTWRGWKKARKKTANPPLPR
jgi:hypothetical protein